jgi:division protein CdvB (Snf7/Vps24/ESCRT-III family)
LLYKTLTLRNRSTDQRILELEAQLEDMTEIQERQSSTEVGAHSELRKRLTEQLNRSQTLEESLQAAKNQVEDLESKLQVHCVELVIGILI